MIRNELEIQVSGLALEPLEPLLAESGFIMFHASVDVLLAKFEQAIDQTGEFVRHGGDGFGRAKAGSQASLVRPQSAFAVQPVLSRQAQGIRRAVAHVAGATFEHFTPTAPVVRTEAEPRGEGFFALPPAHIQAELGHEGVRGEHLDAVKAGQVDATDAVELGVEINVRLMASGVLRPTLRGGQRGG